MKITDKEFKPTKGEWVVKSTSTHIYVSVIQKAGQVSQLIPICDVNVALGDYEANTSLIADAGTTYNRTGKTPSELEDQNKMLLEALNKIKSLNLNESSRDGISVNAMIKEAIKSVEND
jgi:hypothetical protein